MGLGAEIVGLPLAVALCECQPMNQLVLQTLCQHSPPRFRKWVARGASRWQSGVENLRSVSYWRYIYKRSHANKS